MPRYALTVLGFIAVVAAALAAQGTPPTTAAGGPPALWTVSADLAAPESAFYDAASNAVFVSNINGQILDKDGNGYISRLTPEGKVVNMKWATGLNGPKGLRSSGRMLWAADIDEVVGIEIASGKVTSKVRVEGASFLNDLATAPDGTIFVSDSNTSTIFTVKDGKSSVFVAGADVVEQPNGLLVDGGRLILGTIGPAAAGGRRGGGPPAPAGRLYAFDLRTQQRTTLTPQPIGGIDGVESDGRGGLLVTDVIGSKLLHVDATGAARTLLTFTAGGADFGYVASRRLVVVPFLFGNSVSAWDVGSMIK